MTYIPSPPIMCLCKQPCPSWLQCSNQNQATICISSGHDLFPGSLSSPHLNSPFSAMHLTEPSHNMELKWPCPVAWQAWQSRFASTEQCSASIFPIECCKSRKEVAFLAPHAPTLLQLLHANICHGCCFAIRWPLQY